MTDRKRIKFILGNPSLYRRAKTAVEWGVSYNDFKERFGVSKSYFIVVMEKRERKQA